MIVELMKNLEEYKPTHQHKTHNTGTGALKQVVSQVTNHSTLLTSNRYQNRSNDVTLGHRVVASVICNTLCLF